MRPVSVQQTLSSNLLHVLPHPLAFLVPVDLYRPRGLLLIPELRVEDVNRVQFLPHLVEELRSLIGHANSCLTWLVLLELLVLSLECLYLLLGRSLVASDPGLCSPSHRFNDLRQSLLSSYQGILVLEQGLGLELLPFPIIQDPRRCFRCPSGSAVLPLPLFHGVGFGLLLLLGQDPLGVRAPQLGLDHRVLLLACVVGVLGPLAVRDPELGLLLLLGHGPLPSLCLLNCGRLRGLLAGLPHREI